MKIKLQRFGIAMLVGMVLMIGGSEAYGKGMTSQGIGDNYFPSKHSELNMEDWDTYTPQYSHSWFYNLVFQYREFKY